MLSAQGHRQIFIRPSTPLVLPRPFASLSRRPSPPRRPEQQEHAAGRRITGTRSFPRRRRFLVRSSCPLFVLPSACRLQLCGYRARARCSTQCLFAFSASRARWRSAARLVKAKLPAPLPLLALKSGDVFYSMPGGEPLRLAGCRTGGFATACGKWLVYQRSSELLLVDPFSGATMTLPPPTRVYDFYQDEGGDGDSDSSRGGHGSAVEGDDSECGSVSTDKSDLLTESKHFKVFKLMLCSPNLVAALFQGKEYFWVAVCHPGGSTWSVFWKLVLFDFDMAFYKGKLYVVHYEEDLTALDISVDDDTGDPWVSGYRRVINEGDFPIEDDMQRMLYLVESCGSLLLVRRRFFCKHTDGKGQIHTFAGQCEPDVSIFKADFGRKEWVEVTTLADDQALFLGPCSRAVCVPQGESPNNRVWFLDDYKDVYPTDADDSFSSGTSSVASPQAFSPLPAISWRGYLGKSGAAWLFPSN